MLPDQPRPKKAARTLTELTHAMTTSVSMDARVDTVRVDTSVPEEAPTVAEHEKSEFVPPAAPFEGVSMDDL